MAPTLRVLTVGLVGTATAQQVGTYQEEQKPAVFFAECTNSGGCERRDTTLTMDAQWRWLHDARPNHYENCILDATQTWQDSICTTGSGCADSCALEGIDQNGYRQTYGVQEVPGGIRLKFKNGDSIGSRLYMMEDDNTYKMFKLLNREFSFDVDVSHLACGINGAVYFVEMEANGGMSEAGNAAGAKYGTGYCDAQCPHDLKFIQGEANLEGWHQTRAGPRGRYGVCCAEMDIWEANNKATAFTTHACETEGPLRCEGDICGDVPPDCECCGEDNCQCCGRWSGVCDKDGCDYNTYRLGDHSFYGSGSEFAVDTTKPMTVVTQFITSDNTDTGDLVEIRRLYVQDGQVIQNSRARNLDTAEGAMEADSITDEFCTREKAVFGDPDDFNEKQGLKGMGRNLDRGMVLVLSLWDDMLTNMTWLDSRSPPDAPAGSPGVLRGPCEVGSGDPSKVRANNPDAYVTFTNVMVGEIGSTMGEAANSVRRAVPNTGSDASVSKSNIEDGSSASAGHAGSGSGEGAIPQPPIVP